MASETREIRLDKSKQVIITDPNTNELVIMPNGCLLLWDKEEQNIIEVSNVKEVRQHFGVEVEESVCQNDTGFSPDVVSSQTSTIPTCDVKKSTAFWKDENAVKTLIYQWKQHQSLFENTSIRNDVVWTKISEELEKANSAWQYTGKNCENKFKDISKVYKRTKDHNNQTGVAPKTCKYFQELEEVLGEKPCLKPVALASSLRKRPHPATSSSVSNTDNTISDIDDTEDSGDGISIKAQKPKKTRMERELELWSKTMSEENKIRDEARERRHHELLERQDLARQSYETYMEKLIKKL
ncbi:uncharacterized protein LOC143907048 [Temnothorax americanus]|uniref:uncharacterized protein LOC143907048 n=1 Tax=Temnothorax americanus TaxID=1964332 RepID=UPI004069885F